MGMKMITGFIFIIVINLCKTDSVFDFSKKRVRIHETNDPTTTQLIYRRYGVGRNKNIHVCQSVDGGKSNYIFGELLCKRAIAKLYPTMSLTKRVECERDVPLFYTEPNRGEKPSEIIKYHKMAQCLYGDNRILYLANTPKDNFYYVVNYESTNESNKKSFGTLSACLQINLPKKPSVEITHLHDTIDPLEADNIFGVYGSLITDPRKPYTHLCAVTSMSSPPTLFRPDICEKAIKLGYFSNGDKVIMKEKSKCENKEIIRRLVNVETGQQLKTPRLLMVTCVFESNLKTYSFDVLNGPAPNRYYIIEGHLTEGWIRACVTMD